MFKVTLLSKQMIYHCTEAIKQINNIHKKKKNYCIINQAAIDGNMSSNGYNFSDWLWNLINTQQLILIIPKGSVIQSHASTTAGQPMYVYCKQYMFSRSVNRLYSCVFNLALYRVWRTRTDATWPNYIDTLELGG